MPASAKGTARTGQRQRLCCRNPGWVSLWVLNSERGEREAESLIPRVKKGTELAWSKKGVRREAVGWKLAGGLCSAVIFMEKAIKPCSLINGHHQDLFPAQIKLKVMDGAANSRQSWGWLSAE